MNVRLAVQLLSATTLQALKYFVEKGLRSKNWSDTSEFNACIDSWSDLFSATAQYDKKDFLEMPMGLI